MEGLGDFCAVFSLELDGSLVIEFGNWVTELTCTAVPLSIDDRRLALRHTQAALLCFAAEAHRELQAIVLGFYVRAEEREDSEFGFGTWVDGLQQAAGINPHLCAKLNALAFTPRGVVADIVLARTAASAVGIIITAAARQATDNTFDCIIDIDCTAHPA